MARQPSKSGGALLALVGGLGILVAMLALLQPSLEGDWAGWEAVALSFLSMTLALVTFLADRRSPDHSPFSPLVFLLVFFSLFYAVPALYSVWGKDQLYAQMTGLAKNLSTVMAIAYLGFFASIVGYTNPVVRRAGVQIPFFRARASELAARRLWLVFFVVGWVSRVYLFGRGNYLQIGTARAASALEVSLFGPTAFLLYFSLPLAFDRYIQARRYQRHTVAFWRFAFVISIFLEYLWAVPTGSKGNLMMPVLEIIAVLTLRRGLAATKKLVTAAVVLGLVYYVMSPVTYKYRQAAEDMGFGEGAPLMTERIWDLVVETAKRVQESDPVAYRETGRAQTLARIAYPTTLNEIINYFDRGGRPLNGETYWLALIAPIPRILWHSKPVLSLGSWFGPLFGFSDTSSYAISQMGELYINFELPGVLIGMVLWGMAYRILWNMARVGLAAPDGLGVPLYVVFWVSLLVLGTGDNFAGVFGGAVRQALILTAAMLAVGTYWGRAGHVRHRIPCPPVRGQALQAFRPQRHRALQAGNSPRLRLEAPEREGG